MRYKTDRIKQTGQRITAVRDKDFFISVIDKPHTMHNHKSGIKIYRYGDNSYQIEIGTSFLYLYFSKSFNVKTELPKLSKKLQTFDLAQEAAYINALCRIANREFDADYERRQLSKLARGNDYRTWKEFYQDAELLRWGN